MKQLKKRTLLAVIIALGMATLTACGGGESKEPSSSPADTPESSESITDANGQPGGYDYSKPVPKTDWVKKDYFNDAVFIGDSVSTGISIYEFMENSTVYAERGISPSNISTKAVIDLDGQKLTIMDAVKKGAYKKIYILLGANSAEFMPTADFITEYGKMIDELKASQPEALIYIQSVFPITKALNDKNTDKGSALNNETIRSYNTGLQQLAAEKQVYFVNVAEALADANGDLPADYSPDGIHVNATQYQLWFDCLRTHTVAS